MNLPRLALLALLPASLAAAQAQDRALDPQARPAEYRQALRAFLTRCSHPGLLASRFDSSFEAASHFTADENCRRMATPAQCVEGMLEGEGDLRWTCSRTIHNSQPDASSSTVVEMLQRASYVRGEAAGLVYHEVTQHLPASARRTIAVWSFAHQEVPGYYVLVDGRFQQVDDAIVPLAGSAPVPQAEFQELSLQLIAAARRAPSRRTSASTPEGAEPRLRLDAAR